MNEFNFQDETVSDVAVEVPRWALTPSVPRVFAIDEALRFRLAESLAYLAEVEPSLDAHSLLADVEGRLRAGPVSPWLFCLYSKLVAEVAKSPRGDVSAAFDSVVEATSLPADPGSVSLGDRTRPRRLVGAFSHPVRYGSAAAI